MCRSGGGNFEQKNGALLDIVRECAADGDLRHRDNLATDFGRLRRAV
jgi:hypothetical protein